ncbi:MAG TPA: hypothetical protein VF062_17840 [Candidatus Limnocylindrales bacterium]
MRISTWTRDLISSLIGAWIIVGIYIDGWAHVNMGDRLETFFTPWHAVFYSGLAAFFGWLAVVGLMVRRPGDSPQAVFGRLPVGYKAGTIGAAIFAVGGAADMFWHELLGIETSIDALLSPPHIVLLCGFLLMGTTAWRSQRAVSDTATIPELISLASVVAVVGFFLNYLAPFRWAAPNTPFVQYQDEQNVILWIAGLLAFTMIFLIPVLWQLRDGRYRIGTLSGLILVTGTLLVYGMSQGWSGSLLMAGVLGATAGAILVELLLTQAPWRGWRYGPPIVMGIAAFTVWSGQLVGYHIAGGVQWPLTLWLGTLLVVAGSGAAVGAVAWRPPTPPPPPLGDVEEAAVAKRLSAAA